MSDNNLGENNNACANLGLAINQVLKNNSDDVAKMAVQEYANSFVEKNRRLLELANLCKSDEKNKAVKEYLANNVKPEIGKIKSIEGMQDTELKQLETFEKEVDAFLAK